MGIQTLTVSDKALLTCTSLLADDKVKCKTAIIGDLTISGNIIFVNPQVWNQCVTIQEDGGVCCPLTVRNTNIQDPQLGNAFCVEGSTVMLPITDPATSSTAQALLFLDGTQLNPGFSNLTTGDYLKIDARPLSSGTGIGIDLDSGAPGGIESLGLPPTQQPANAATGTYPGLTTTSSGTGIGAILTVVINPIGTVSNVVATSAGNSYSPGDTLTVSAALIAGATLDLVFTLIPANIGIPMTGKGIQITKGGSSLENTPAVIATAPGGRLLYINAPAERGQNYNVGVTPNVGDAIALAEIAGPSLTDISKDIPGSANPLNPPGLNGIRQSALWVNSIPAAGAGGVIDRHNPVGSLWIDGGTVFSSKSTTTVGGSNGQGHLHSRQVDNGDALNPPTLGAQTFNGNPATGGVGEEMFVFYGQLDSTQGGGVGPQVPPVGGPPPREPGNATDVSGIIGFQSRGGTLSRIAVNFAVPYPEGTVPLFN